MEGERLEFKRALSEVEFQKSSFSRRLVEEKDALVSPMPGKVVSLKVKEGQRVGAGEPLIIIESMKMESVLRSDRAATVKEVLVAEGVSVKRGQPLLKYDPA